jgi:hypothetical protein
LYTKRSLSPRRPFSSALTIDRPIVGAALLGRDDRRHRARVIRIARTIR